MPTRMSAGSRTSDLESVGKRGSPGPGSLLISPCVPLFARETPESLRGAAEVVADVDFVDGKAVRVDNLQADPHQVNS